MKRVWWWCNRWREWVNISDIIDWEGVTVVSVCASCLWTHTLSTCVCPRAIAMHVPLDHWGTKEWVGWGRLRGCVSDGRLGEGVLEKINSVCSWQQINRVCSTLSVYTWPRYHAWKLDGNSPKWSGTTAARRMIHPRDEAEGPPSQSLSRLGTRLVREDRDNGHLVRR